MRFALVMEAAEFGSFDWDVRVDQLVFDERSLAIFGFDPQTFDSRIASFWDVLLPEDQPAVEAAVQQALDTCGEYRAEYRVRHPDGSVRWVEASGRVLAGEDGKAARLLGVARDSTELVRARDTVTRALEHMADAFLAVDGAGRVTFLNRNAEALVGTDRGAIGRPLVEVWPEFSARGHDAAVDVAVATGETQTVTTYLVDRDRWYQLRIVPVGGDTRGFSLFGTDVTDSRAAALAERRELSRPEQARRVLAYTAALADADTLAEVVETVATMALPAFGATGMLVSLVESGRLVLAGHTGYSQELVRMLEVLHLEDDAPIPQVTRSREPLFLPSREAYLGVFPGRKGLVEATGKGAWCFLPMIVAGRSLGTLTISFDQAHELAPDERSLLVGVSGLIAQTLARARLRESERMLAAELQEQLLPRALPELAGVASCARYLTATDGMGVGGDWFDLLELPGQRIGLVIGDVQGHNMRAAAVMGQLRSALRAYAAEGHEPAAVLSRTNRMMSELDPSLFATCAYVLLDVRSGGATLALAGHPPPFLRSADGRVTPLEAPVGAPLGVAPELEYRHHEVVLSQGDLLVLFTDGLVEDARRGIDEGLDAVGAILRQSPVDDLDALTDRLMSESLQEDGRSDDVAVLALRFDGLRDADRPVHARTTVDRVDPRAARAARDFIAAFVRSPEVLHLRDTCVLLVSEVVTNALRHTEGEVTLELWRYPAHLRVEVSDETSRGLVTGGGDLLDESGRGVPLMDALSDRWGTAPHGQGKVVWFELDLPA
jgi:PAS domain S-box-containing protein